MTTFFKSVATLLAIVLFSKTCLSQSNSIHLDGVDDYIEMDDIITSLVGKTNFSIEITTKLDIEQPQDYAVLFSANSNTAQLHRFLIRLSGTDESISNVVVLNIPANGQYHKIVGITPVLDGNCHHISWTHNNGLNRLYVDGVLQGSLNQSLSFQNSDRFSIGQEFDEPFEVVSQNIKGQFDEFRIWDKTLTQAEINASNGIELNGDELGLVDYFKFNQGIAGGNNLGLVSVSNVLSTTRNGTLIGFSLNGLSSNWVEQNCIEGIQNNNALHLDGVDDYVNISAINPSLIDQDEFSIEMKFKPDPNQIDYPVLFSSNSNTDILHRALVRLSGPSDNVTNVLVLNIPDNGQYYTIVGTTNISSRKCHHFAWTYNNGENKLYVDGILQGTLTKTINFESTDRFSIGQEFDEPFDVVSQNFHGEVDEFRVWNKELSSNEITDRINAELLGNENNLTNYYKFIDGIALANNTGNTNVTNSVSSDRNGELVNFALNGNTSNYIPEDCQIVLSTEDFIHSKDNSLSLYPNPANETFTLVLNQNDVFDIEIIDVSGKIIRIINTNFKKSIVDVSDIAPGMYVINIKGQGFNYTSRIIIQ